MPRSLQNLIINFFMVVNPSFVVREFQSKGVPHKLDCLSIHVMTEQVPDPESQLFLSESRDSLGMPRAKATWKISEADRHNILRIGHCCATNCPKPDCLPRSWLTGSSRIVLKTRRWSIWRTPLARTRNVSDPKPAWLMSIAKFTTSKISISPAHRFFRPADMPIRR